MGNTLWNYAQPELQYAGQLSNRWVDASNWPGEQVPSSTFTAVVNVTDDSAVFSEVVAVDSPVSFYGLRIVQGGASFVRADVTLTPSVNPQATDENNEFDDGRILVGSSLSFADGAEGSLSIKDSSILFQGTETIPRPIPGTLWIGHAESVHGPKGATGRMTLDNVDMNNLYWRVVELGVVETVRNTGRAVADGTLVAKAMPEQFADTIFVAHNKAAHGHAKGTLTSDSGLHMKNLAAGRLDGYRLLEPACVGETGATAILRIANNVEGSEGGLINEFQCGKIHECTTTKTKTLCSGVEQAKCKSECDISVGASVSKVTKLEIGVSNGNLLNTTDVSGVLQVGGDVTGSSNSTSTILVGAITDTTFSKLKHTASAQISVGAITNATSIVIGRCESVEDCEVSASASASELGLAHGQDQVYPNAGIILGKMIAAKGSVQSSLKVSGSVVGYNFLEIAASTNINTNIDAVFQVGGVAIIKNITGGKGAVLKPVLPSGSIIATELLNLASDVTVRIAIPANLEVGEYDSDVLIAKGTTSASSVTIELEELDGRIQTLGVFNLSADAQVSTKLFGSMETTTTIQSRGNTERRVNVRFAVPETSSKNEPNDTAIILGAAAGSVALIGMAALVIKLASKRARSPNAPVSPEMPSAKPLTDDELPVAPAVLEVIPVIHVDAENSN